MGKICNFYKLKYDALSYLSGKLFHKINAKCVGVSLPERMFLEIERRRGDISRSMFIRRMLEEKLQSKMNKKSLGLPSPDHRRKNYPQQTSHPKTGLIVSDQR